MKINKIQEQKRTRRTLWWKIPLGLLLVVFVGLVVVVMNVNSIAHSQANQALEKFLSAGGVLDDIDVEVMAGRIKLSGLAINQPQGYGTDPFLLLDTLELDIDPLTLVSDKIIIEKLTLAGVSLTLVRDKQGQFSFDKLISSSGEVSNPQPAEESKEESQLSIPAIRVNSIHLENISIRLFDQLTGEQWSASLRIDLDVNDLQLKDILNQDVLAGKMVLALSEIEVDQPVGFGSDKLASLENFTVRVDKLDLASADYIVKQVLLQGLDISMIVHEDGLSNFQQLNNSLFGADEEQGENTETEATETVPPTVLFEQIQVENGSFTYRNETLTDDGLVFPFNNIELKATQLRLYDDNTAAAPAAISLSFELDQPDELASAYFGSVATLGPVADGVPMINGQVRLAGLKLDTFGSLVSRKVRTSLGASGLDAG
ncbi:MAG: AsmA family protein, partial [Deltaproteobacteria bacterium]|nr:AsmA family protein [Deltaproteobacteria bacterium]